jgi:hypothetical protein
MLLDLPSNRAEAWRWSDLSSLPALAQARPRAWDTNLTDLRGLIARRRPALAVRRLQA